MRWLFLALLFFGGLVLFSGGESGSAGSSGDLILARNGGAQDRLRHVADVPWQGSGMRPGSVATYCAKGAIAVGRLHDYYFALNGETSQLSDRAMIRLPSGTERRLLKPTGPEFQRVGVIEVGADPLEYNRPFSAALTAALGACG